MQAVTNEAPVSASWLQQQQGQPVLSPLQQGLQNQAQISHPLALHTNIMHPHGYISGLTDEAALTLCMAQYFTSVQQLLGSVVVAALPHGLASNGSLPPLGYTVTGQLVDQISAAPQECGVVQSADDVDFDEQAAAMVLMQLRAAGTP
jgi:hypothetical protein